MMQFIVVRTKLESIEGRKATVTGQIEDLSGQVLAKASYVPPPLPTAPFHPPSFAGNISTKEKGKR